MRVLTFEAFTKICDICVEKGCHEDQAIEIATQILDLSTKVEICANEPTPIGDAVRYYADELGWSDGDVAMNMLRVLYD